MTGDYDSEAAKKKIEKLFTYEGKFNWRQFLDYARAVFRKYEQAEGETRARKWELYTQTLEILIFLRDSDVRGDIRPLVPFLKRAKDLFQGSTGGTFGLWPFKGEWYGQIPSIRHLCDQVMKRYGVVANVPHKQ